MNMSAFPSGTLIDARFEIRSQIGAGGMGSVYEAFDGEMNRLVAIKFLQTDPATHPDASRRFRSEAVVLSQLEHPNIVAVYSIAISSDHVPYIVMELIKGVSLSQRIRDNGALPWREALSCFLQVCDAVQYAHSINILHRDIKPANVVLQDQDGDTVIKVVDFGIAKIISGEQSVTRTGVVVGTPAYTSPEQLRGQPPTVQSDVYALGCSLFEMLTGAPPFIADNVAELAIASANQAVPEINKLQPAAAVPGALQQVVACALSKEPATRYATVAELRADLQAVLEGMKPRNVRSEIRARRRQSIPRVVAGLALLTAVTLVVAGVFISKPPEPPGPVDPSKVYADMDQQALNAQVSQLLARARELPNRQGRGEDADAALKEAEALSPYIKDPNIKGEILRIRGRSLRHAVETNGVPDERRAKQAIESNTRAIEAFQLASKELDQKERSGEPNTHLRQQISERLLWSFQELAISSIYVGHWDEAENAAKSCLKLGPSCPRIEFDSNTIALKVLQTVYCSNRDSAKAEAVARQFVQLCEHNGASKRYATRELEEMNAVAEKTHMPKLDIAALLREMEN